MNPVIPPDSPFLEPGVPWTPEGSRLSPAGRLLQLDLTDFLFPSFGDAMTTPTMNAAPPGDECGAAWR